MPGVSSQERTDGHESRGSTPRLGYALSSEEHAPNDLVRHARVAEEAGFTYGLISDHYHPWIDRQGHSPFVWSVLGAIAHATERFEIGTGVTCPTVRTHPAIIAQAAATIGTMMPGRFFLGVGTGEALNEHILGDKWPEHEVRSEMLEESIEVIRALWQGDQISHYGPYYTVENARIYDVPDPLPRIVVAAAGPRAGELAGRTGDGLCSTSPDREVVEAFRAAGGDGPIYGQLTLCWAEREADARRTALEIWPNAGITGEASQELPVPAHFEQLATLVTEEKIAESIPCGPDPQPVLDQIQAYADAGFDHVYLHQIGPDQAGFLRWAEREILSTVAAPA